MNKWTYSHYSSCSYQTKKNLPSIESTELINVAIFTSPFNWNRRKMSFTLSKNEKEQFEKPENDSTNISAKSSSNTVSVLSDQLCLALFLFSIYSWRWAFKIKLKKHRKSAQNPPKRTFAISQTPRWVSAHLAKCALTFSLQLSMVCCFLASAMKFYYSHGAATAAY